MSSGIFLYPPNDSDLSFNYLDTVNVTWNTYAPYATNVNLQLYIQEGTKKTPVLGESSEVCSISAPVSLTWVFCSPPDESYSEWVCPRSTEL